MQPVAALLYSHAAIEYGGIKDIYSSFLETSTRLYLTLTRQTQSGHWVAFGGNALLHYNKRIPRCSARYLGIGLAFAPPTSIRFVLF